MKTDPPLSPFEEEIYFHLLSLQGPWRRSLNKVCYMRTGETLPCTINIISKNILNSLVLYYILLIVSFVWTIHSNNARTGVSHPSRLKVLDNPLPLQPMQASGWAVRNSLWRPLIASVPGFCDTASRWQGPRGGLRSRRDRSPELQKKPGSSVYVSLFCSFLGFLSSPEVHHQQHMTLKTSRHKANFK